MAKKLSEVIKAGLAKKPAAKVSPIRDAVKRAKPPAKNYGRK